MWEYISWKNTKTIFKRPLLSRWTSPFNTHLCPGLVLPLPHGSFSVFFNYDFATLIQEFHIATISTATIKACCSPENKADKFAYWWHNYEHMQPTRTLKGIGPEIVELEMSYFTCFQTTDHNLMVKWANDHGIVHLQT